MKKESWKESCLLCRVGLPVGDRSKIYCTPYDKLIPRNHKTVCDEFKPKENTHIKKSSSKKKELETRSYNICGKDYTIVGNEFLMRIDGIVQRIRAVRKKNAPPYAFLEYGTIEQMAPGQEHFKRKATPQRNNDKIYPCRKECIFHTPGKESCRLHENGVSPVSTHTERVILTMMCNQEFKHFIKKD